MPDWFGYEHVNGGFHLKRYGSYSDIEEASFSGFVAAIYGPWYDNTRKEALKKLSDIANIRNEESRKQQERQNARKFTDLSNPNALQRSEFLAIAYATIAEVCPGSTVFNEIQQRALDEFARKLADKICSQ